MKTLSTYLSGMMLWAAMTLTETALERTQPSQAAQSTYTFTLIAVFASGSEPILSIFAEPPVITNDGIVVYSAGIHGGAISSIFSSDGTVTRFLVGSIEHTFQPLAISVSGNGIPRSS